MEPSNILQELERAGVVDGDLLAEIEKYFRSRGKIFYAKWMELERVGYERETRAYLIDIHRSLGRGAPPEVIKAILRSRVSYGALRLGVSVFEWPHFFVESVDELHMWMGRLSQGGPALVDFSFDVPPGSEEPSELAFRREVFAKILASISYEISEAIKGNLR